MTVSIDANALVGQFSVLELRAVSTPDEQPPPGCISSFGSAAGDPVPCSATARVTLGLVDAVSVDATAPHAAKVNYRLIPQDTVLDSATFTAPGTAQTRSNVSGDFYFTFDQSDLITGNNTIRLESRLGGGVCTTEVVATRMWAHAPPQGTMAEVASFLVTLDDTVVPVPVLHEIFAQFAFICYLVDVVPGSKTLWVGVASVNIRTEQSPEIPTEIAAWNESHLYRNTAGDHLRQLMVPVTEPTIPPQGPHFRSVEGSADAFFAPGRNLTLIATIDSLSFATPNGPIVGVPPPLVGNTQIDLPLEPNADPAVDCP